MKKWFLEVVQDFDGSYYANLTIDAIRVNDLPEYVDYNTLRNAIKEKTGIEILKKKDMIFQQNGRKKYAYIDCTQERKDCRVTLDEMYKGWEPNFDSVWITVYKDVLGYQDDKDNLTEILVPKQWFINALKLVEGVEDYKQWCEDYTADNTITLTQKALREGVVQACSDENITLDGSRSFSSDKSIYERAANMVDDLLSKRDGEDLFYIANVYYTLSFHESEQNISREELLKLTEKIVDASYISVVPVLTAERVDAVKAMLECGITEKRSVVLPELTPEQAKKVLLNCELEDFCTIVDQLAVDNQQFYAPDKNDITSEDIDNVEKAVADILREPMALEEVISNAEAHKGEHAAGNTVVRDFDRDF